MAQTMFVPIEAVFAPREQAPLLLADLAAKGVFTAAVTLGQHVLSGGFAARVQRDGARTNPLIKRLIRGAREGRDHVRHLGSEGESEGPGVREDIRRREPGRG